jgi:hypothetical protein
MERAGESEKKESTWRTYNRLTDRPPEKLFFVRFSFFATMTKKAMDLIFLSVVSLDAKSRKSILE